MLDALWLATPLQSGGVLWSPTGLSDRDRTPQRVLELFGYVQLGRNAPAWAWWRPKDTWQRAHQYPAAFSGTPNSPARCGVAVPEGELERHEDHQCPACLKLERGIDRTEAARNRAQR